MKRLFLFIPLVLFACRQKANQPTQDSKSTTVSNAELIAHGNKLSAKAQNILLAQVSSAMAEGGPVHAIHYCNLSASGLMDTLSEETGAVIKRVALKNRNPKNFLKNERDSAVYSEYEKQLNQAQELKAKLYRENGEVHFYKPILMQMSTCLKCHGTPGNDIAEPTLAAIAKRYPEDQAVNFKLGDLRGLWKISFPVKSVQQSN